MYKSHDKWGSKTKSLTFKFIKIGGKSCFLMIFIDFYVNLIQIPFKNVLK